MLNMHIIKKKRKAKIKKLHYFRKIISKRNTHFYITKINV